MKFVTFMEPLHTVNVKKNTTHLLMFGCHQKGHEVYYVQPGGLSQVNSKCVFKVTKVIPQQVEDTPFIIEDTEYLSEDEIDVVFLRSEPPFDQKYLHNTWLLEQLPSRILVFNSPSGIRNANEKIWANQHSSYIPESYIGQDNELMNKFIADYKDVIVKPTDGFGGKSVFHIVLGDSNTQVILETLTNNFQVDIIMQKFIPESKNGDKRILLLNGEPLGAVLRVHSKDDHRNNFFAGGQAVETEITEHELEIIKELKPHLEKENLYFVGIDILGKYLTEVNVTAPTCLVEMNHLYKKELHLRVIDFIEKTIEK